LFENLEKIRGGAQFQNPMSFELVVQSGKVRDLWKGKKPGIQIWHHCCDFCKF